MSNFKYALDAQVLIIASGEQGAIIGRAEYGGSVEPEYLVRYRRRPGGNSVESWLSESALRAAERNDNRA